MTKKLKAAAYCRVSTDRDDQANSLVSQRTYFEEYINSHDSWILSHIYYDEGISGTQTKNRAGFNAMIQDAFHGEIDLILTKEVSRFARNTVDTLSYTRKLKEIGVGVVFTIDNIDTRDPDGELRLTIMASIAQEESRKTSQRVKWGQKRRMEQGVVFGRNLLGYTVKNGKLYINEEEADIVRAIFHKYTNEGKGTHVIARELLEEGISSPRTGLWSNVVILRVLRNEKYVGDLCQKKTITPDYLTHRKKENRGEEDMVYLKDHHEPIIDRVLWERTLRELDSRRSSPERRERYSNRYWCSGKLYCGICEKRYVSRCKNLKDGTRYQARRCYTAIRHGPPKQVKAGQWVGCGNLQINNKTLLSCMKFCVSHIQDIQTNLKEEILCELDKVKNRSENATDTKKIRKEIAALNDKKRKAIDLTLEGVISREELKEQNSWYAEELDALSRKLEQAQKEHKVYEKQIDTMEPCSKALDDIINLRVSNETLYKELLEKIYIYPDLNMDIWLNALPFGIRLEYKTSGKGKGFSVEIVKITTIPPHQAAGE